MIKELDTSTKIEILKFLLSRNGNELQQWRDVNLRIVKESIVAIITLSGLSLFSEKGKLLALVIVALAIVSSIYLAKNYKRYQEKKMLGARIESALGFFEEGFYCKNTLFPQDWKTPKASRWGTGSFIIVIWIIAVAASIAVFFS